MRDEAYWDERWARTAAHAERVKRDHADHITELVMVGAQAMCDRSVPCDECLWGARKVVEALDSDGVVFARMSTHSDETGTREQG